MSAYTKGPWFFQASDNGTPFILSEDLHMGSTGYAPDDAEIEDALICHLPAEISRNYNSWPNARLMAAAPELLEALKGFVEEWDELCMNQLSPAYIAANAAIAKAEAK